MSSIHHKINKFKRLGKADLHIHTNFSDGKPSVEEVLEYVENNTDLDVIAISDHDTIEGAKYAHEIIKQKQYRFELIVGEEISCIEGHILGLFLKEPIPPNLPAEQALQAIKDQGGISIAAHPLYHTKLLNTHMVVMNGVGIKTLLKVHHKLDALEIVNATPTLADENVSAAILNRTLLFRSETGSSDAHILDAIGKAYTAFEGKTSHDLKNAVRHRQTQALYSRWSILALFKYLWFFIPMGLRLIWFNISRSHETWPVIGDREDSA